ncbi:hypothetical protein AGIG_G4970 [Arapaima gigas]
MRPCETNNTSEIRPGARSFQAGRVSVRSPRGKCLFTAPGHPRRERRKVEETEVGDGRTTGDTRPNLRGRAATRQPKHRTNCSSVPDPNSADDRSPLTPPPPNPVFVSEESK